MEVALVWYIVLNLAIFGFVVLFVRAARSRVAPHEPQDLEENALVNADWERVRRERCLPSHCRRVLGQPPRPRKDVTCEICAATFLDSRLQRLLGGPLSPERGTPGNTKASRSEGSPSSRCSNAPESHRSGPRAGDPLALVPPGAEARRRAAPATQRSAAGRRWGLVRFLLGIACTVAGAAVAAFGGLLWLILPGYGMVLIGLALILSGALSGAV